MSDLERKEQAKEYASLRHRLAAVEALITLGAFVLFLTTGSSIRLRDFVLGISSDPYLSTLIYYGIGVIGLGVLVLPLTFINGYVLPHRYDLSNQRVWDWAWDMLKGGVLSAILGGLVIEVLYLLLRVAPQTWWLITGGFILLLYVGIAILAPILILPLFYRFQPLQDPELVERLMRLTANANTRVYGIYTMILSDKTNAGNAAFMGLGRTRRIVLGDTLYDNFTADEIEVILAHELAHQVHNDIVWGIVVQSGLVVVGLYIADLVLRAGTGILQVSNIADLAAMPLLGLALGIFGLVTLPLGNWYSRWRETSADQYALETTRNPQAFISAFEKLAYLNLAEMEPEPWVEWLFYDHPPIGKRVAMGYTFETPA